MTSHFTSGQTKPLEFVVENTSFFRISTRDKVCRFFGKETLANPYPNPGFAYKCVAYKKACTGYLDIFFL